MVEPLTAWKNLDPQAKDSVPAVMLTAKGQGTDDIYAIEVDQSTGTLPVEFVGTITATNPSVGPTGAPVPADATMVGGTDGTDLNALHVTSSGVASVDASSTTSLPLPTGAATATLQSAGNTSLATIATNTPAAGQALMAASSPVVIASNQSAVPVSIASVPLPTGAATAALQTTGNTSLATIATNTPAVGQAVMASSSPVVIASNQSAVPVSGTVTANAGSGTFTVDQTTTGSTFQEGSIAAGSLTTSYATVLTTGGVMKHVDMRNETNGTVVVSLNGGSTTSYTLTAGDYASLDLKNNGGLIAISTLLQAKYSGSAPTTGSIYINGFY